MKKKNIKPVSNAITVTPVASLLLQASSGRTTNNNFSRRLDDEFDSSFRQKRTNFAANL
ncbi:MAG: hypothetical protein IKH32_06170 [Prevotella sp.]|nr:hypothetical protein [Prevotella sp.]